MKSTAASTLTDPATTAAQWRQSRYNPNRGLTAASLTQLRDAFDAGYLRGFSLLSDQILDIDDTAGTVAEKRIGEVSRRPWDILIGEDVPEQLKAQATEQQTFLKAFYSNLKTRNAIQLNQTGSLRLLISQMMQAPFLRYAAHEIAWEPSAMGLTATLWSVPLAFLEDTTGTLRFSGVNGITPGQVIEPENWVIAVHRRCLMKSLSVLYYLKKLSLSDWVNFSEKFGMPGLHLETTATAGSKEWQEAANALASFSRDWSIVTTQGQKINLIEAATTGDGPYAPMVDRCDRAMARVVLGSDLATLSRENGAGASLQGDDTDGIITDDCEWVSETLNEQLTRRAIEWQYGEGTPLLAFFKLAGPQRQDTKMEMEVDNHVKTFGVNLSAEDIAERYGRTHTEVTALPPAAANEAVKSALSNKRTLLMKRLQAGLKSDLKPAAAALESLLTTPGLMPDLVSIQRAVTQSAAANEALEVIIAAEFLAGLTDAANDADVGAANVFNPLQARDLYGKFTDYGQGPAGAGKKKQAKKRATIREVVSDALTDADNADFVDYAEISAAQSLEMQKLTGDARDLTQWTRVLVATEVQHAIRRHARDARPITPADFEKLPERLAAPLAQVWVSRQGRSDVLMTTVLDGTQMTIIEEQRVGRQKLSFLTMYRP